MLNKGMLYGLVALGCTFMQATHAQNVEAEWRVVSNLSPTIVPSYVEGTPNPFPVRAAEIKVEAPKVEAEDPAIIRQKQKGEILEQARKIMEGKESYRPNMGRIGFSAFVEGAKTKKVLYQGRWLSEGDSIEVPIQGSQNVYTVLERLKEFDAELAKTMMGDFDSRMMNGKMKVKIYKIQKDKVILTEGKQTYEVKLEKHGL